MEQVYEYTFGIWLETDRGFQRETFDLLRDVMMQSKECTEREFNDFHEAVSRDGFSLREIARRPIAGEWEAVQ
jgi:hypothetical protein